jgi:CRP-like cAMP-binding protein
MAAGTYFGEIGLLERIPRTATVTSVGPSRMLRIDGEQFLTALTDAPASASMLEGAQGRLSRTHPSRRHEVTVPEQRSATEPDETLLHGGGD